MTRANEPVPVGIGEDAGAAARILQEQYFLMYQLPNFIAKPPVPPGSPGWNSFSYPVELDEGNSILQNAFFKTSSMKVLNKMAPSLLSSLVPEIRIFKIFYQADGKQVSFNWEIPFTDFVNPDDVTTILDGRRGTLGGVNIIDFSYNFIGTNKAEAETSLTAKLKLKFSSIDSLLQTIYLDGSGNILPSESDSVFSFRYSDLVNQESKFEKDTPSQFNKKYYRIKILVGLRGDKTTIENIADKGQFIGTDGLVQNFSANSDIIEKAINSTRMVLHLYPINHTLNFEDDGTITLDIEFRAALDSVFGDEPAGDLFLSTEKGKAIFDRIQKFAEKKKEQQKKLQEIKEQPNSEEEFKSKKEEFDQENTTQEEAIQNERSTFLSDFLGSLFYDPSNPTSNICLKRMRYSSSLLDERGVRRSLLSDIGVLDGDEQATNREYVAAIRNGRLFASSQNKIEIEYLDSTEHETIKNQVKEYLRGKKPDDIDVKQLQNFSGDDDENITFFYLGDILEYFISRCLANYTATVAPDDIPKFIIGNIPLILPLEVGNTIRSDAGLSSWGSVGQTFSSSTEREFTTLTVNLSKIPISYNYFLKWYVDTILKTKKQKYPINIFFNDLTNLIQRATMNVYGFSESSLLNTRTVNMNATVNGTLFSAITNGPQAFRSLFGLGSFENGLINSDVIRQTRNLHVLYVNAIPLTNIDIADPLLNETKGIFTFTIGKNIGLLKSLKFNKSDLPFVKEARMTQEGSLTRGVLLMKYNASVNLFGTCVFRPGDIFVINPVFLTTGNFLRPAERVGELNANVQKVLINDLGLGGIYCVTKCGTSIAAGKVETNVECVFQAYGAGSVPGRALPTAPVPGAAVVAPPGSATEAAGITAEALALAAQQTWDDIKDATNTTFETIGYAATQTAEDIKLAAGQTWDDAKAATKAVGRRISSLFSRSE